MKIKMVLTILAIAGIYAQIYANEDALKQAIMDNDRNNVQKLLDTNPNLITAKIGSNNLTPLEFAVEYTKPAIVEFLLEKGADVNTATTQQTPLHRAIETYHNAQEELKRLDSKNPDDEFAIEQYQTTIGGMPIIIRKLLEYNPNLSLKNNSKKTVIDLVKEYNLQQQFPELANTPSEKTLAETLIDIIQENDITKLNKFLNNHPHLRNASLNNENQTPLHIALLNLKIDAAQQLIDLKANLSAVDKSKNTPLILAITAYEYLYKRWESAADDEKQKLNKERILLQEIIDKLIKETNLTLENTFGQTALHVAISSLRSPYLMHTVRQILEKNPTLINTRDSNGKTPLFLALLNYDIPQDILAALIALLLEKGADPSIVDISKKSPLKYFQEHKNLFKQIADLLENSGMSVKSSHTLDFSELSTSLSILAVILEENK